MSEVITISTPQVQFKDKALLTKAIQNHGVLCENITDIYKKKINAEYSIITQEVPNGIGFTKVKDEYIVKGDEWGHSFQFNKLLNKISQSYQKHAWEQTLKKHRYTATISTKEDQIIIEARGY